MDAWLQDVIRLLPPDGRTFADGLSEVLNRHDLSLLDGDASAATADDRGFHVDLVHRSQPDLNIAVESSADGEILVLYGPEEQTFRSSHTSLGRVWPWGDDHTQAALTLIEYLLTGRIELQVWRRPLAIKTHSYYMNDDGELELFSRATIVGPVLGWSREPEAHRFDYR